MTRMTIMCALLLAATKSWADEPESRPFNLKWSTLGGMQFWSDEQLFHDWRIQRNVFSGHHRLLDGDNVRHAWGSLEQCQQELTRIKQERDLPPMRKHAVLVLHGLYGTRGHCQRMARYLNVYGGYQVMDVAYPSTQDDLTAHGAWFERLLGRLDGVETVDVVAHSLGNLVVRAYLAREQSEQDNAGAKAPKLRRMVMVGPPSNGAVLAQEYGRNKIWEAIGGKSGRQLAHWEDAQQHVAVPNFPFGIVAGSLSIDNPLIPGPDDGVVTVADARIAGACDFMTIDDNHMHLMNNHRVQRATLRFLRRACFVSESERSPIDANGQ